jgi:serine/threonine protein kinase
MSSLKVRYYFATLISFFQGSAYKILEEAGTGAFGKVYVGLATKFSTKVAIKKCRRLNSGDDRKTPDPIAEAKILKDLSKINDSRHVIAQYIDSFVEGDYHYLVMDYCPHGSIFDYVCKERNNRPLTEDHGMYLLYLNFLYYTYSE